MLLSSLLVMSCGRTTTPETMHFDPAPGTFEAPIEVSIINLDDASAIFYTTDGTDPTDTSTEYTGAPIPVADNCNTTPVQVMWTDAEGIEHADIRGDFHLNDGTCVEQDYINRELLLVWLDYEKQMRCEMNDCENPSFYGDWHYSCENGGSVDWVVESGGDCGALAIISTTTYSGCQYTTEAGTTLTVEGELVGDFCTDGHGTTWGEVAVTGDWSGGLIDDIEIGEDSAKVDGHYLVACSDEGCAPEYTWLQYLAPDWTCTNCTEDDTADTADTGNTPETGGEGGWYALRNKSRGRCLADDDGNLVYIECDTEDLSQRFSLTEYDSGWQIALLDTEYRCVHDDPDSSNADSPACEDTDEFRWTLSGSGDDMKLENAATGDCLYAWDWGGDNVSSWLGCSLITDLLWGFYAEGSGDPVVPE